MPSPELLVQTARERPASPPPPDTMASKVEEYGCRRLPQEGRFACRIGIRYDRKTGEDPLVYHEWIFRATAPNGWPNSVRAAFRPMRRRTGKQPEMVYNRAFSADNPL